MAVPGAIANRPSVVVPRQTTSVQTPQPVQKESGERKFFQGGIVKKAFDILQLPEFAYAGFGKGAQEQREKLKLNRTLQGKPSGIATPSELGQQLVAGIKNIPSGIRNRTQVSSQEGDYNVAGELGIKNKYAQGAYNFATSMAVPAPPIAGLVSRVGRGAKIIPGVSKIIQKGSDLSSGAVKAVRQSPKVAKAVENVVPYFRNPEFKPLLEKAEAKISQRVTQLNKQLVELSQDLSPAEQARIGQLMEGGITAFPEGKLKQIAQVANDLADTVGKEAVDLNVIPRESFEAFKGKYMSHIWSDRVGSTANKVGDANKMTDGVNYSGQFFKQRKGAEGYIKQFAPATFKGLGTEIKDIETIKFFKEVADKFGIRSEPLKEGQAIVNDALNSLIKDYRPPKPSLGPSTPGFKTPEEIGWDMLNVFKEFQPARKETLTKSIGTQIRGIGKKTGSKIKNVPSLPDVYKSLVQAEMTGKTPQAVERWVVDKQKAFQQIFGYTPDEGDLRVILEKVGQLPEVKLEQGFLDITNSTRIIPEGYSYAPDVLTKKRGAEFLKDIALPNEIIDYLKGSTVYTERGLATQAFDMVYNAWKAGKTIWNPAYHVRNIISNQILSQMSTGKNIVNTIIDTVESATNYFKKGGEPFLNKAEEIGLVRKINIGTAFNELLDSAFQLERVKGTGIKQVGPRAAEMIRNFQNATEEVSKVAVFRSWVEELADDAGITVEKALADESIVKKAAAEAEKAIFSPYKISQKEREMVSRLIPFYSFTRQIIPFVAETLAKRPNTLKKFPKIQTSVESLSDDPIPTSERQPYQEDQIQLPIKVNGENVAFDPTFIYPFGNLGEADITRGQLPGGLSINPLIMEPVQQVFNKDLYFDKPIADSQIPGVGSDVISTKPRRAGSQRWAHVLRTGMPGLYTSVQGKIAPALRGEEDYAGRTRSKMMAALDFAGIKLQTLRPDDVKSFNRYDREKKLDLIRKDMRKIQRDRNLTQEQKNYWNNQLKEEMLKTAREK